MPEELIALDGLRARDNGAWGREKLSFIDNFGPPALQATKSMRTRVYVDLFAGPGKNIVRGSATREEYDGSPLRILQMRGAATASLTFTHAYFVNHDSKDHATLEQRVNHLYDTGKAVIPRPNVTVLHGDANEVIAPIFAAIHPLSYVFVFADIEAPKQWPWSSVEAITARGHRSVDLYSLFPLDMAILRLLSYEDGGNSRYERQLTEYFGTDAWRELTEKRVTNADSPRLKSALIQLYIRQLKTRWKTAGSVKDVRLRGNRFLYRMMFASNHQAGSRIARWAATDGNPSQGSLF